jgi:uncharacterized protein (TIGR03435 family)
VSSEQLKLMLQQLLVQRFKLATHRSSKDLPGYALTVAKGGPNLQASKGAKEHAYMLQGGLRLQNASVEMLAGVLAHPTGRPVSNATGIEGRFDITLDYAPEGATDSALPSIFTALQEQLGLRLMPQKVPVEIVVIDHVERVPTEN